MRASMATVPRDRRVTVLRSKPPTGGGAGGFGFGGGGGGAAFAARAACGCLGRGCGRGDGDDLGRRLGAKRRGGAADLIPELPVLLGDQRAGGPASCGLPRPEDDEAAAALERAGDLAGRVAGAEEDVAARRADNGRAGVLRDHQPAPWRAVGGSVVVDEDRRAEAVDQAIDGEAPAFRERDLGGSDRAERRDPRPAPRERR